MRLPKLSRLGAGFLTLALALPIASCQTAGSGTKSVSCSSFNFVWLSRKDTQGTIRQVGANNAAWISLCGNPKRPT